MAAQGTAEQNRPGSEDPRAQDARERAMGDPDREMAEHAANGAELDRDEERSALDYLLGGRRATVHDVEVQWESEDGLLPLTFVLRPIDSKKIGEIEERHRNRTTGMIDRLAADCEIVAAATDHLVDPTGRKVKLTSREFLFVSRPDGDVLEHAAPPLALEDRFRDQLGLVQGVANEIRRIQGWTGERVGQAQRRMVRAALG